MKITSKQANPFSKIAFPNYTGRKFFLEYKESVTLYNTNWDGGSKNEYSVIEINTLNSKMFVAPAPWVNMAEGQKINIPSGMIVVCHSYFCGSDMGLTFYCNPIDAPKLLN